MIYDIIAEALGEKRSVFATWRAFMVLVTLKFAYYFPYNLY